MSNETIMLATTFEGWTGPCEVSVKLDGVAADFRKGEKTWTVRSRSDDKPILSVQHLLDFLNQHADDVNEGVHFVAELTVVGVPVFKEASGIIRRKVGDERIVMNVYDIYHEKLPDTPYSKRREWIKQQMELRKSLSGRKTSSGVHWLLLNSVPVRGIVDKPEDLQEHLDAMDDLLAQSPMYEGYMIRHLYGPSSYYQVAKRSKGFQRLKPKPTLDLRVLGFEEATANKTMVFMKEEFFKGEGLEAVGRINCEYNGGVTGVGPGCLTHEQRRDLWRMYVNNDFQMPETPLIAEVEFMKDDTYGKLRQPVFKRWRLDKTEPSEVA